MISSSQFLLACSMVLSLPGIHNADEIEKMHLMEWVTISEINQQLFLKMQKKDFLNELLLWLRPKLHGKVFLSVGVSANRNVFLPLMPLLVLLLNKTSTAVVVCTELCRSITNNKIKDIDKNGLY